MIATQACGICAVRTGKRGFALIAYVPHICHEEMTATRVLSWHHTATIAKAAERLYLRGRPEARTSIVTDDEIRAD